MGLADKFRDKIQQVTGKGKKEVGKATGDRSLQAEGTVDEASGNLKQAGEKVKDAFDQ